jgi:chitodextrinase
MTIVGAGVLATLLALQVGAATPAAAATPTTYQGSTYPTAGPAPTEDKPQSKLWFNDGAWWALMRVTAGVTIHRLQNHVWHDTGTVVDERIASTGDALWENGKLYVASRVSGGAMRAIRFSYDAGTDTHTLDFSKQVAANGTESMSIARDSTGRLWVAYTQGSKVYVAHSTTSDTTSDTTWAAPFLVPVPDNTVSADDIAGIVAFGTTIGVMWSDQDNDVMRFAVHPDTAAPTAGWTMEDALAGPNLADDHLNLKSLSGDSQGRIYAAVKTSRGDAGEPATDPSIVVLERTATGTWTGATAATVADRLTRPQIALDTTNNRLYVLMSTESGGTVHYKSSPLGALSFPTGVGAPFVQWSGASINDASTTKQTVDATTGLVVLASDDAALRYYHAELALGTAPGDAQAPTPPTGVTAQATSSSSITVSWGAATDDVGVTDYRVFRDGVQVGTATTTSYTDTGLTAGTTYSYTVAAADAAGNVSAQSEPAEATPPAAEAAAVSFVGAATGTGSGTSTTVPAPVGATTGDLLVAAVSSRGAPVVTAPAGWTEVRVDSISTTMRQALFVRTGTTDNSSTWSLSRAQDHVVQVLAYRGVDTADPVISSAGGPVTSTSIPHPAVSVLDGARVVTVAGIARTTALTPGSPLTERSEITTVSTARYKVSANTADLAAQGTTAGPYATGAGGSAGGIGQTLALRPAAGGTAPGPGPDTTPPSAPPGVTAAATSPTSADVAWQASADVGGVTGYQVFRDGIRVGTATGTSFTDTGLTPSTQYSYTVAAVDTAGNVSAQSAPPATVTTPTGDQGGGAAAFVAAATGTSVSTSTAVTSPAGVQAGDVLIAAVSFRGTAVITPHAGWTLIRSDAASTTMQQTLFVKVATGPDAASTWRLSREQTTVVQVLAYRGVDTADPVIASAGATSTTATLTSPAVASAAGSPVITFAGIARTSTLTAAAPLSEVSEASSPSTARYALTAGSATATATGTTAGSFTTTASGNAGGVAQTIALRLPA